MKTPMQADPLLVDLVHLAQQVSAQLCLFYADPTHLDIQHKTDESPVTAADLMAHHLIEARLTELTPDIPVLSEESVDVAARRNWSQCWLVDPLDGTKEFINRTGEFTVNIARIEQGQVSMAVIALPLQQQVFATVAGMVWLIDQAGHWQQQNAEPPSKTWRIAVSRRAKQPLYQAFLQQLLQRGQDYVLVEAGSAYKFCLMAMGKIDVYPRFHPTSEWDTAAGQALLEAIGGCLVALDGRPFVYNQRDEVLNAEFIALRCAADWSIVVEDLALSAIAS